VRLVLVGNGPQILEGKKIVEKLNLQKNVIFFGQINDRKEIFELINSADVCLNLSEKNKRQDSASCIKVFEYSALGKPVISTRLKEVELLNFPNIIFYKDAKNNTNLSKAIKSSFNKEVDLNKMKKFVEPYTWENLTKQFERVLKKNEK
jgi:glycosyltransferase involved in cell wall biosynthesis